MARSYDEYCRLYFLAERKIKQVETLANCLPIPAVNQLRYAGYHCCRAIDVATSGRVSQASCGDEPAARPEQDHTDADLPPPHSADPDFSAAIRHCQRAIYDALEFGIIFMVAEIDSFRSEYRGVAITPVIAGYVDDLARVNATKDLLAKHNRHAIERAEEWEKMQDHFDALLEIHRRFELAREELNKELNAWRRGLIIALVSLALTFFGTLIALIALLSQ